VALHTANEINAQIERETVERIARIAAAGPEAIEARLRELDGEWDIERRLETNASAITLVSLGLGWWVSRWWLVLTGFVSAFLLQHALQGWCPPVPILRRMGSRTEREIDLERMALRLMRGDFAKPAASAPEAFARVKHGAN